MSQGTVAKAEAIVIAWMEKQAPMGELVDAIALALHEAHAEGMNSAPLQKELAEFNRRARAHVDHIGYSASCPFCAMKMAGFGPRP